MQVVTFLFILAVMLQLFRKNPNKKKEEGKNYKKGGIEIWLRYFFIGYHYFCLWCFPTPRPWLLTFLQRFASDIIPWTNLRNNTSRECSRICIRDVVNLLLSKLLMNACMRDLWVRQGLSHGMLLRSLGSFLCCDDTLVDSGSGEWNEGKLNLSPEPLHLL